MIAIGASGDQAELPFSIYHNMSPVTGYTFTDNGDGTTSEVQIRLPGGVFEDVEIANIVEWGNGQYAVQLTAAQTANPGKVSIYVQIPNRTVNFFPDEIGGVSTTAIVQSIMEYSHEPGATFEGLLIRLEAFLTGKATGLNGATGKFYRRDGVTVAFEGVVDPNGGTRQASNITGSES